MSQFDVEGQLAYLKSQDTIFVTCYEIVDSNKILLGIASARLEIKPYEKKRWLYVDELLRLRSIKLISMKKGYMSDLKDHEKFDLANHVKLTPLGKRWVKRIVELENRTDIIQ